MRTSFFGLLGLAVLLATTGCLQVKSTSTLKKDGSGSYRQTSHLDLSKALEYQQALIRQGAGFGLDVGEAEEDPFKALDPKKRAADLADCKGVRVKGSFAEDKAKQTRTYEMQVEFDSLRAFYEAGVVDDVSVELKTVRKGKAWELTIRNVFDGNDQDPPEGEAAARRRELRAAMLAPFEKWWGTVELTSTLTLPSKILKTNGKKSADGRSVTWHVGFKDLNDPRALRQTVTFENTAELKLKAFQLSAQDIANAREEAQLAREEAKRRKQAKR